MKYENRQKPNIKTKDNRNNIVSSLVLYVQMLFPPLKNKDNEWIREIMNGPKFN